MLWAVGGRFHFDGTDWPISKLIFWYRGHVFMYNEEKNSLEGIKNGK